MHNLMWNLSLVWIENFLRFAIKIAAWIYRKETHLAIRLQPTSEGRRKESTEKSRASKASRQTSKFLSFSWEIYSAMKSFSR